MQALTAADCLWRRVRRVLDEERAEPAADGTVFAVFSGSLRHGAFCGLATEHDVALHPEWIFADLVGHRPISAVAPTMLVRELLARLETDGIDALPVVSPGGEFVGAVTRTSLLRRLLDVARKMQREARRLHRDAERERQQVQVWAGRLTRLHEASRTLLKVLANTSLEGALLQSGVDALRSLMQARYAAVGVLGPEGDLVQFVHSGIDTQTAQRIGHAPVGRGLLGAVLTENTVIRLSDMAGDPRSAGFPPHHPPMTSLLAVPIARRDQVYGRLYLSDREDGQPFDAEDELLAVSFAHSLSLILDNAREFEEIQRTQSRLDYLAHFDTLTGLPNRELAADRARQALHLARRQGSVVALLFVDLDHFKTVNDSFGHALGDQLLQEVAQRLMVCTRDCDTVARQAGDEFLVLLPGIRDAGDAASAAQKILETLAAPFELQAHETYVSASVGVSLFPADGETLEQLLAAADKAMYQAKLAGRGSYRFYTAEMTEAMQRAAGLERSLRLAMTRGELSVHYQPIVDIAAGGRVVGTEALLRWNSAEFGPVSPGEFIPIAEDSGLIVAIGEWVLRSACLQAKEWSVAAGEPRFVAVNLCARQLRQRDFAARVAGILVETGAPADLLILEITESATMHDIDAVAGILTEIQAMGVRIAVDDFGTGHSSLSYLKRLPINKIKIDRSFIRDLGADANDAVIVAAIIAMAHSLGLVVVAEGVETRVQLDYLLGLECDCVQGYLFGRPMPAGEVDWKPRVPRHSDV